MQDWHVSTTTIPGIGLLIVSTSNLLVFLSIGIKTLITGSKDAKPLVEQKLIKVTWVTETYYSPFISFCSLFFGF